MYKNHANKWTLFAPMPNTRFTAFSCSVAFVMFHIKQAKDQYENETKNEEILEFYRWFDGACCCLAPWRHLISYFKSHHWTFETCIHLLSKTKKKQIPHTQQNNINNNNNCNSCTELGRRKNDTTYLQQQQQDKEQLSLISLSLKLARPKCEQVYAKS